LPLRDAHELRLAVPGQIGERRRFVVGLIENLVANPVALFAFRVLVPGRVRTRKANDQNVVPPVVVEVVDPGEEVVRVLVLASERSLESRDADGRHRSELQRKRRLRRIVFAPLLEVGTLPPPRPGDDVVHAVVVQIAEGGAFAPELIVQLDALETARVFVFTLILRERRRRQGDEQDREERTRHNR
jgi:hypothetical protein